MAEMSEMYQASLRPHPPYKPLPDETAFVNYFSPPPVPTDEQGNYVPYYYPAVPQQPPVPPLPFMELPPPAPQPAAYNTTGKSRASKTQARATTDPNQPMLNFMMYAAVLFGVLLLFALALMFAYAMAGKHSVRGRGSRTDQDLGDYWTRLSDAGFMRRATMVVQPNDKASATSTPGAYRDSDNRPN